MENASKALLIAAGVLVGLMIVSLMIYGVRQVSDYYKSKEEAKEFDQLMAFNKQYINYRRDDVRGSEIITLVNKIVDYNAQNKGDEISISIEIPSISQDDRVKLFHYQYDKGYGATLISVGKKTTYKVNSTINQITTILNVAKTIESKYTPQGMAKKLADNLSTLMGENSRKTRDELLQELKINYTVNNTEILKYYQYQQFKRAHFDCEELTSTDKGRVKSFKFIFNGTFE